MGAESQGKLVQKHELPQKRNGKELEDLDDDVQLVHKLEKELQSKRQKVDFPLESNKCDANTVLRGNDCSGQIFLSENRASSTKVTGGDTPREEANEGETDRHEDGLKSSTCGGNKKLEKSENPTDSEWSKESEFYRNIDSKLFRQYDLACERVKDFYSEQHEKQTVAYNIQARINFKSKVRAKMSVWDGLEKLNKLLDESDPDTELSQIDHALQTAEAIRRDGKPRWMQLVGLIHDLGKLLYFFDLKGQWDVVGDTFPVGCKFLRKIIFSDGFRKNPDFSNPLYNTKYGIYSKKCGLDSVMLSWGHDEYMYHIAKINLTLPPEALAMIRYHSFYPWHHENAYRYLMSDEDEKMLEAVRCFNRYDLYLKTDECYDVSELMPYYIGLIDEYFPQRVIEF
ncbi:inositol oxygenase [Metschnikowia aff. pulcherrima]|uniref:Inositol oxygenase n=1 Tax=Metschnikowia aff. pulcherrima TaxID=2163413 RepID=A0A4P6XU14_9ASCO|nr:inositol oxygenase [Metschnikowia aff. pulcherrima]